MKLEVGMYVRTEYGIEKIVKIKESCTFAGFEEIINTDKNEYRDFIEHSKIKKASHNIIDLIEENDVVVIRQNGDLYKYEVFSIPIFSEQKLYVYENVLGETTMLFLEDIPKEYIVSILTKEQFESMSYKL